MKKIVILIAIALISIPAQAQWGKKSEVMEILLPSLEMSEITTVLRFQASLMQL